MANPGGSAGSGTVMSRSEPSTASGMLPPEITAMRMLAGPARVTRAVAASNQAQTDRDPHPVRTVGGDRQARSASHPGKAREADQGGAAHRGGRGGAAEAEPYTVQSDIEALDLYRPSFLAGRADHYLGHAPGRQLGEE